MKACCFAVVITQDYKVFSGKSIFDEGGDTLWLLKSRISILFT